MIAEVGSIGFGHKGLSTPDLLRAFAAALESLEGDENREPVEDWANCPSGATWDAGALCGEALAYADVLDDLAGRVGYGMSKVENNAAGVVDALIDALDDYAPDGCSFGAHEGDGADFGFWPVAKTVAS